MSEQEYKFCNGKHKCQICGKKYECQGIEYGHANGKSGHICNGEYEQFCENHTISEYHKKHVELGDITE